MKRVLLSFSLMFSLASIGQNVPVDFETGGHGASWTWTVFENSTNPAVNVMANPDVSGINTSATVAKFTALQAGNPWAGCETMHGGGIGTFTVTAGQEYIRIMVWKPVISDVGIKLVDATGASLGEIKVANTVTNQWEELTFNFSSMIGNTYDQIVIFPDFNARTSDNDCYFDNITFGPQTVASPPMVAAPTPTIDPANVISMFSNAYTDITVDTWRTSWSSATLTDIQIQGDDTKEYTSLDFVGVETVGPNLVDATSMNFLHLDIWTPNMTTFRVKLVDFGADGGFQGGDDSEHEVVFTNFAQDTWVSYDIPLTDFTNLASRANLAQFILSGLPAGSGTLYVDNVYYTTTTSGVGLNEREQVSVKVFPNPTADEVHVVSKVNINEISLFTTNGKEVKTLTNIKAQSAEVSLADVPSGVYLIHVKSDANHVVKRVVKN